MVEKGKITISSFQDRLGRFAERFTNLLKWLGDLESRALADEINARRIDRPVYISGLARAGSTILLELLAAHSHAVTHRYKDFPLVYMPFWFNWFVDRASRTDPVAVERFHKDRILITPDSPEAMEEILWMAFFPDCHDPTQSNVLGTDTSNQAFERFYKDHIRKLLYVRGGNRYIAKGNYNVTRLGYLMKLFPDARFIIPVRDPVGHVASLMKQHRLFCEEERRDPRILDYMRWAGHFEFGLDRRPVNINDLATVEKIQHFWQDGHEVRGFARLWASTYKFVAAMLTADDELKSASLVVHYDNLCGSSYATLERVYNHCELAVDNSTLREQAAKLTPPVYYSVPFSDEEEAVIEAETRDVHEQILRLCAPCA
jgi:hypothetical protein